MFQSSYSTKDSQSNTRPNSYVQKSPGINLNEMMLGHENIPGLGTQPAQMKENGSGVNAETPSISGSSLQSKLPDNVQSKMENSFGTSFADVAIHQNDSSAANMGALAYTQGNNVHFAPGEFNPNSTEGQELLGHELAHVVQQRQGRVTPTTQGKGMSVNNDSALENEADTMGMLAAQGKNAQVGGKGNGVQKKSNNEQPIQAKGPGDGLLDPPAITAGIGVTLGTGGPKINFNVTVDKKMGDFTASYGFGITYHGKYYSTGKKGWEMRNSLMLDYEKNGFGAALGTNWWTGFGEMSEFNQRTGMVNLRAGEFGIMYENDGVPFDLIGLSDGGDSYRTAAASIQLGDFSLNTNLFTGLRDETSFLQESLMPGGKMGIPEGIGQFGEEYTHGFVFEQGTPYRYGGLTLNYKGQSIGIDSDRWVRHPFQNILAHDWIADQRQFETLSDDINLVLNSSNLGLSKFTTWGQ